MDTQENPSIGKALTREDELLLSRYYDGECGMLERWKVKRLLRSLPEAAEYLDSLNEVGKELCLYETSELRDENGESVKIDLWSRIERRIESEERSALFLGERRAVKSGAVAPFSFDMSKLAWGLSGSMATAAIVFLSLGLGLLKGPQISDSDLFSGVIGADRSGELQEVSMVKREISSRPARRPIEVDWVRSDGRVHVIPDPGQRSAIIWVKRQRAPIIDLNQLHKNPAQRSDRPVIIEENVPRSLAVAGPRGR